MCRDVTVGVLELEGHPQILADICNVAADAFQQVVLYTHESIYHEAVNLLDDPNLKVVLQNDRNEEEYFDYISQSATADCDVFYIPSMYGGLNRLNEYTKAFPDVPTVLRIDNVNAWFCSQQFTEYGSVEHRVKQSILGQCDAVTVANSEMKRRVEELTNESRTPVFEFIPVYNRETSSGGFHFTVPGRVDEERRTYEEVVSAFDTVARQVGSDQDLADVRLTLLGSMKEPYGTKIVDSMQGLDDRGLETRYFRDRVPGDEFVTELRSSDVVVSPIHDSYTLEEGILGANSIDEEYGTTKPTGNVHDALRYGKPVLISDRYGIPDTTYDSMIQYGSRRELATVLSSYITDTEYRDSLVDATGRSSRKFDLEQQSSRFEEIVRSVLREADL